MFDFDSIKRYAGSSAYPPGIWEGDPAAPWNQEDLSEDYERIQKAFNNIGLAADWLEEIDNENLSDEVGPALDLIGKAFIMLKRIL